MSKILVIEDDKEILAVMELILIELGYIVEGSADGAVLKDINSIRPDLIILDDRLGGEKGSDLCVKLKSDPDTSAIPVILFTADINGEEIADHINADAFVAKPFDIDDLSAVIDKLI